MDIDWSISEGKEEELSFPVLNAWMGYQLPSGIFSISAVNGIQAAFQKAESCQTSSGETFYKSQLQLKPGKVANAICRIYAPDQVKPEIKMELGIPLPDLLESATLPELKGKLESLHRSGYQAEKKARCIATLAYELERESPRKIFGKMEMQEYLNFRQLVLTGSTSCADNASISQAFPVLWNDFRISFVKKQGVRISKDLLQEYEKWFDSAEELQFRRNKRMRQAMRWCAFYYGIFPSIIAGRYCRSFIREKCHGKHWRSTGKHFRTMQIRNISVSPVHTRVCIPLRIMPMIQE